MRSYSNFVDQSQPLSQTVTSILDVYFDMFIKKVMDKIIDAYDLNNRSGIIGNIRQAVNNNVEFGSKEEILTEGQKVTIDYLNKISQLCHDIKETDKKLFNDCKRLIVMNDEQLNSKIGQYLQEICNKYITTKEQENPSNSVTPSEAKGLEKKNHVHSIS